MSTPDAACVAENRVALPWRRSPLEVMHAWSPARRCVMLLSGRPHAQWGRQSLLACPTAAVRLLADPANDRAIIECLGDLPEPVSRSSDWAALLNAIGADRTGMWIGQINYEFGEIIEPAVRTTPPHPSRAESPFAQQTYPTLAEIYYCPAWLSHDTLADRWHFHTNEVGKPQWLDELEVNLSQRGIAELASRAASQAASIRNDADEDALAGLGNMLGDESSRRTSFEAMVEQGKQFIAAGDVFEVNLAHRLSLPWQGSPNVARMGRAVMSRLALHSQPWFGGLIETGGSEAAAAGDGFVASASPELFLRKDATGRIITRPIKGSLAAGDDHAVLQQSEKDQAELNMIVDLMRNDLGRVCQVGSLRVLQPRELEQHPSIQHGVATVVGQLRREVGLGDVMAACFPAGSVTGAPKIRAMQLIRALEAEQRGPYCGSLLYAHQGQWQMSVAIRTAYWQPQAHHKDRALHYHVGCGIVADSVPAAEYEESLWKAAPAFALLNKNA